MTLISGGGFLPTDSLANIISSNFQKLIFIFSLFLSMFNFYLIFNIFDKKILIRDHKEDLYLLILSIILIILVYFSSNNGLDLIISVISSLSNSGLTLIKSDNLSLYYLFITIIGGSLMSNSSGIKLARFYILLKITSSEIIKLISPNSIINKTIFNSDRKITDENVKISFLIFISFFLSLFILSSFLFIFVLTSMAHCSASVTITIQFLLWIIFVKIWMLPRFHCITIKLSMFKAAMIKTITISAKIILSCQSIISLSPSKHRKRNRNH